MPDTYLSDIEKIEVESFCNNIVMREAVRKVLLAEVYLNGTLQKNLPAEPLRNAALIVVARDDTASNESVGAYVRAVWQGINFIESGFSQLNKMKPVKKEDTKEEINKAR